MQTSTNFKQHDTLIKGDPENSVSKENRTPSVRFQQTIKQPVAKIRQFVSRKSRELEDEESESETNISGQVDQQTNPINLNQTHSTF